MRKLFKHMVQNHKPNNLLFRTFQSIKNPYKTPTLIMAWKYFNIVKFTSNNPYIRHTQCMQICHVLKAQLEQINTNAYHLAMRSFLIYFPVDIKIPNATNTHVLCQLTSYGPPYFIQSITSNVTLTKLWTVPSWHSEICPNLNTTVSATSVF